MCLRGLTEDAFLAQLRATFPQMTEAFDAFTIDASRKPMPVNAPEEIYHAIESASEGRSTPYIRRKAVDQQQNVDETRKHGSDLVEIVENKEADVVSISSGTHQVETGDGEDLPDFPDPAADCLPSPPGRAAAAEENRSINEETEGQTVDDDQSLTERASNTVGRSLSPLTASSAGHSEEPAGASGRKEAERDKPSDLLTARQLRVSLVKDARISMLTKTAAVSSQDFLGHTEEKGGNDGAEAESAETAAQSSSTEQETREPAHQIPSRRGQSVKTRAMKRKHFNLRVCLIKDLNSSKLKHRMLKSQIRVLKFARGTKEADFLEQLRSTFPQLTGPFEAFTTDTSRTLRPLKANTLTPENVYKSIKSSGKGRSALYIRVQTCETKEKKHQDADSLSASAATSAHCASEESDEEHDGLFLSSTKLRKQVQLRVCLLKDRPADVLKKSVVNSPVWKLNCARGMDEATFLDHLRSTFPQLTGPFDAFTSDATRKLLPLNIKMLTPEKIYRAIKSTGKGRSALYIRAKQQRLEKELCEERTEKSKHEAGTGSTSAATNDESAERTSSDPVDTGGNKDADASSSSATQPMETDKSDAPDASGDSPAPSTAQGETTHSGLLSPGDSDQDLAENETDSLDRTGKQSGRRSSSHVAAKPEAHTRGDTSEDDLDADWDPGRDKDPASSSTRKIQKPLQIRVCLLEDTQTSVLSTKGYKSHEQMLQCPRGLRGGQFLDLLRSTFPDLPEGDQPLDAFLVDKHRRLQPLEVTDMTPEEICRSMRSSGNGRSALYVRLKITKAQSQDEATSDALPTSNTRKDGEQPHASSNIGRVGQENSSEGLQSNSTLQTQVGREDEERTSEQQDAGASPAAPASDDGAVDESDGDVEWKPDENDEEPGQSDVKRRRPGKSKKNSMKSPPQTTAGGFYSCKACGSLHRTVNTLLKHAWTHVDSETLCGVCGERAEELRGHLDGHQKTHMCDVCGRCFFTPACLRKHTVLHSGELRFKCDLCPKAYANRPSLLSHQQTHLESKPYKCDVCHQSFVFKAQMEAHASRHTGDRPYRCDVCGKAFNYFRCLSLHMSIHTGHRRYACQVCGKRFKMLQNVKLHEKTHTARDRSHLCDICSKTFFSKSLLHNHMMTHGGEKTLCSQCGKGLSSAGALKRHMIIHANTRPYSCSTCGQAFNSLSTLRGHARTHSGEKRFVCMICGKATHRREYLKIHMRSHNGERPYKCTVCDKDFTQSHCLKTHMKSHQVEKVPRGPASAKD